MYFGLYAPLIDVMTESVKESCTTYLEAQQTRLALESYATLLPADTTDYPGHWMSGLG